MPNLTHCIVLLAVFPFFAVPGEAQHLTYDWSTGARTEEVRLRAGERIRLDLRGLNTLCYTPHVNVTATEATVDLAKFVQGFSPPAAPGGAGPVPPPPVPPPPPPPPPAVVPVAPEGPVTAFEGAIARLESASVLIDVAERRIQSGESVRRSSAAFTDVIEAPPCAMGRAWNVMQFVRMWEEARAGDLEGELIRAQNGVARAVDELDEAAREIEAASAVRLLHSQRLQRNSEADTQRARLAEARRAGRELATKLSTERDRLRNAAPQLNALEKATAMSTSFRANQDVEQIRVVLTMTPIPGQNAPVIPPDTISESVHRRFRVFVSTGAFVSLMRHRDFERTNRPVLRDTTVGGQTIRVPTDSTYSTFANRRTGLGDVVSPTLQLNVVFADLPRPGSGFPVMASIGVAARTVGGSTLPEPFLGLSLGINDRLMLGGGVHYGRNETLLLTLPGENAEDVAERRIPASITSADAVGVGWSANPYITVSVRL